MLSWRRHVPNVITAARGLAGFGVAWLLLAKGWHLAAFFLYIFAILTDLVDGWLAKRWEVVSETGAWLDPLSDKFLAGATWIALWSYGWTPTWLAASILGRDLVVVIGWLIARGFGIRFQPNLAGRLMVSYEGVALPLFLLHIEWLWVDWASAGVLVGAISLGFGVFSALDYAMQPWRQRP